MLGEHTSFQQEHSASVHVKGKKQQYIL